MMEVKKLISNLCLFIMVALYLTGTAQANPFAYVADSFENWVSVIDLGTDTVTATVDVGSVPVGIAVSPDGSTVYTANRSSNDISVIDTYTNTETTRIPVGAYPQGVAVSPDGSFVYTAYSDPDYEWIYYLAEIDTASNTVNREIKLVEQDVILIFGFTVSPDGSKIYAADRITGSVFVVDASSLTVDATVAVGEDPRGVSVTPDNSKVLVANSDSGTMSVIDAASHTVTDTIDLGTGSTPWRIAVNPDGTRAYVTMDDGDPSLSQPGTVKVISLTSLSDVTTVEVGDKPRGVIANNDGSRVYVTNYGDDTVSIINTSDNTVSHTISLDYTTTAGGLDDIGIGPELRGELSVVSSIAFADTAIGSSRSQIVTVANSGTADLDFGFIASVDPLNAPFAISNDTCSSSTLAPSESCTFKVSFSPTMAGEQDDALDIPYTTDSANSVTIDVSGFGLSATGNLPPSKPQLVSPSDGQTGLGSTVELRWKYSSDPDGDPLSYQVYCSENDDFSGASPQVAANFLKSDALTAGLGASVATLLLALPFGVRQHRTKICLVLALIAAVSTLSACGGGGGGSSEPRSITPDETTMSLTLNSGTTYYWKVVADDGKDGGARSSDIRTFSTQ